VALFEELSTIEHTLRLYHLRQTVVHVVQRKRDVTVTVLRRVAVDLCQLQTRTIFDPFLNIFRDRRNETLHFVNKDFVDVFVVRDEVIEPSSGARQRAQQIVVVQFEYAEGVG